MTGNWRKVWVTSVWCAAVMVARGEGAWATSEGHGHSAEGHATGKASAAPAKASAAPAKAHGKHVTHNEGAGKGHGATAPEHGAKKAALGVHHGDSHESAHAKPGSHGAAHGKAEPASGGGHGAHDAAHTEHHDGHADNSHGHGESGSKYSDAFTAPIHAFEVRRIDGRPVKLSAYRGKVMLIVNTASQCGLTPQYKGLQFLHEKYKPEGLAILAFPSNDFYGQEPGSNQEIRKFCETEYHVGFDLFEKTGVRGEGISPLFRYLTERTTNPWYPGEVRWNFDKFLVDRNGHIVGRFHPRTHPQDETVLDAIERTLARH